MDNFNKRRAFIRFLVLSGFSLYLPSCKNEPTKKPAIPEKPIDTIPETPPDTSVEIIEQTLDASHVVYLRKEDADFEKLRKGYNLHMQKTPLVIALCKTTEGVAEAIKIANRDGLKVAVKSGGHSFEAFNSVNGGMQINLSLMNKIEWEGAEKVKLQPACLLKDIYDNLLPKKRVFPTGSCGTVGIAGLTLGGGYGFFSRQHGLTCDSLLEAKMVDASGKIHIAKEGDELMWALRGGGNGNFGIVTEFKFQTYPAPDGFTRYRFKAYKLDKERTKKLLQTYFQYCDKLPNTCFAAFVLNYKTLTLLITNYGDDNQALQDLLAAFKPICDKADYGTKRDLAKSLRSYYGRPEPLYFKNASAGYYQNYATIESSIDAVLEVVFNTRGLIYQINTLGGNIDKESSAKNSCYPHRKEPYLSELQAYWEEGKSPDKLLKGFEDIQTILYDKGINKQYRNYPHMGFKDWETAYYGENYPKLQAIKSKYDPKDVFSNGQTVRTLDG